MKPSGFYCAFFLISLGILTSCNTSSNTQSERPADAHNSQNSLDWAATYANDSLLIRLMSDQTYVIEQKVSADSIEKGKGTFSWDQDGGNITLSSNNQTYQVRENELALLDQDKKAVTSATIVKEKPSLSAPYWRLSEINGKNAADFGSGFGREAHLQFNESKNMVSGSSGCNRIFGPYDLDEPAGKIKFKQLGGTMMMCPSMELEKEFTQTIEKVVSYELSDGKLALKGESGEVLFRFERGLSKG